MLIRIPVFAVAFTLATSAIPCCSVSQGETVHFSGQNNIIVWDDKAQIEHFVRRASFMTKAASFGFIAPTPSIPEIESVDPDVFRHLVNLSPRLGTIPLSGLMALLLSNGSTAGVSVVQEVDVGSYHAVTLRADDSKAMDAWFGNNGFKTTPQFELWTKYYVERGWYLTAFTVTDRSKSSTIEAIRMSFKTTSPYNPYYVPAENVPNKDEESGGLKLYMISAKPQIPIGLPPNCRIGLHWELPLEPASRDQIMRCLGIRDFPQSLIVQGFVDPGFPYATSKEDVFFKPSPRTSNESVTDLIRELYSNSVRQL